MLLISQNWYQWGRCTTYLISYGRVYITILFHMKLQNTWIHHFAWKKHYKHAHALRPGSIGCSHNRICGCGYNLMFIHLKETELLQNDIVDNEWSRLRKFHSSTPAYTTMFWKEIGGRIPMYTTMRSCRRGRI